MGDLINGEVPAGWEFTTLGALCERGGGSIQTGPFGSQLHASDYVPVGIPSVMPVNIGDNRIVEDGIMRIREADAVRLARHRLQAGDIVYSRRGDVERRALVRTGQEGWLCGTGCLKVRLGTGIVDPLYASLYLGHPAIRQWIVQHAVGATMPNLNTEIMAAIPFAVPPLPEQKRIAHILGALDDKIELNRRMNATLEGISRAIFKSWFVDFDPVRQKIAGKQPVGMDAQTAALFPDSFEDSEIGEVPKGWGSGVVGDLYDITMGQSPPGETYNESGEGLPFFQGRADFSFRYPERRVFCTAPTRFAAPGDTLVSVRAPVGDCNMAQETCAIGRGVAAVRHKTGAASFTYYGMQALSFSFDKFNGEGTVFGSMGKKDFHGIKCVAPAEDVIRAFTAVTDPRDQQVENLERHTATLAALRDTLLPKLLSGEIRVPEAEEAVEEAIG
jgi:type I restriction enzyme S subunit